MVSTTSLNNSLNCRAGSEDHVTMSSSKTVNIQLNNSAPPCEDILVAQRTLCEKLKNEFTHMVAKSKAPRGYVCQHQLLYINRFGAFSIVTNCVCEP